MKMIKFGFKYILKHKSNYFSYVITNIFQSSFIIVIPFIEGTLIDSLTNIEILRFTKMIIFLLVASGISIFNQLANRYLYTILQTKVSFEANLASINSLYEGSYIEFSKKDPAILNDSINQDCNSIVLFCINSVHSFLLNICSGIFIIAIISCYSWIISLGILISLALYSISYVLFKEKIYDKETRLKEKTSQYFGKLYTLVYYLKSIKLNGLKEFGFYKIKKVYDEFYQEVKNRQMIHSYNQGIMMIISVLTQVFIFYIGGLLILNKKLSIGILIIVLNYYSSLLDSIQILIEFGKEYLSAEASYDRLKKSVKDIFLRKKITKKSVKKIEFQNVSFEYEKNHKLFDISMILEKNKIYQLSGNNGKGKSTFIFLMCGLFKEEYHGVILYDTLEQKELNIEKMNEYMISICEQDPYLFDGTINENLYCKTKKEKRADLRRLLIDFGLFDKINSLDNKFETQISSLNTILSGGEKQKIAIIRTLISDGDVLIFDEPLSALDKKSKIVFQEEISKIKNKIVIIISHEELKKIKKDIVLIKLAQKKEVNEI